jgi:O-antigen biosynthesis protein WbqV
MDAWFKTLILPRNLAVLAHDAVMAFLALMTAFVLRLGLDGALDEGLPFAAATAFAAVATGVCLVTGLYRHVWEYVSTKDALNVLKSATLAVLIVVPVWFVATRLAIIPRSVPIIAWFVLVMFLAGPRLLVRLVMDRQLLTRLSARLQGTPILLIGAGPEAEHFIRAVQRAPTRPFRVLGMVTARPARVGQVIQGVEVLGLDRDLGAIIADLKRRGTAPERVVVVRADIGGDELRRIFDIAEAAGCGLARVPPATDLRAHDGEEPTARPLALEDLLSRPQARLERGAIGDMIRGRRVLVTGAGGSIGAELVRQISALSPAHLTLLDQSEFGIYGIDLEVREHFPALSLTSVIADVRDTARLAEVFAATRPELVFHAAALKQVPLVETNPLEGLLTNAVGTRHVADACVAAGTQVMVLISTDKAVNPASVMGAGKRVGEIYCQALDVRGGGPRFITVRFGNVLGSAGSVVPLFQKQIESGGPLTVTHPEIERYFMTTREAVELVLQASALGPRRDDAGAIYVLDMGAPVKILDLARQMIRLAGKAPDVDIAIKFTGLRPGEKLSEELFHGEEPAMATDMPGILLARPRVVDHAVIASKLTALAECCRRRDQAAALTLVADLVPEMRREAHHGGKPQLKIVR